MTSLSEAFLYIFIMTLIIFLTRAFPFVLFSKKQPPRAIRFIEQYIPPMVMGVLVIYCIKDIQWLSWTSGLKEIISILIVSILHVWKKNAMLSIFGGTACYMVLIQLGL